MKMSKKFAGLALVTLLAPTLLSAQQAFAEDSTVESSTEQAVSFESSTIESTIASSSTEETTVASTSEVSVTSESSVEETTISSTSSTTETTSSTTSSEPKKETKATSLSIPVSFVLADGTSVGTGTLSGEAGTNASIAIPAGYAVSGFSEAGFSDGASNGVIYVSGILSDTITSLTITLYATNSPGVDVNLVDDAGKPVIGEVGTLFVGDIGDTFIYTAPEIRGYKLVSDPTIQITLTDTFQEINVKYERITTNITIICLDTAGNNLMETNQTFSGKFGEIYTLEPAQFFGMQLISIDGTLVTYPIRIEYTDQDQVLTLVYIDLVDPPINPIVPTPAPAVVTSVAPVIEKLNNIPTPKEQPKKALPKTGEESNGIALTMLGVSLVATVYFTKKKRADEFSL